jgi:iron complex outermembrane receptor protein
MSSLSKKLSLTVLTAMAVSAFSATNAVAANNGAADTDLQEVIVTGSRISRTDSETASPVQILSATDMKQSGYTTVAQILQNITANGQGTLSNAFPGAFAGSATGVSLRGLNTSATLVLIDGHRMAPFPLSDDGQRSFVDISSIPFDTVERIEVLKDGASAAYGSDAMAGVVNIILKNRFVGTTLGAEAGNTSEGAGKTMHASATHGMGELDSDGYNAYLSVEYRKQDAILQSERRGNGLWSSLDQTSIGGITQVPGVISPIRPIPPAFGTVYLTRLTGAYNASNSFFYTTPIAPNAAYSGTCTFALQQTGGCAFINPHAEIQPKTSNLNVIASVKKKVGDSWLLDVKASLFKSDGEQYNAGSSANGLVVFPTSFSPNVAVLAGVIPHLVGTTIPAVTVPATYPGNPFGVAARVRGVNLDAPIGSYAFKSKSYRLVADLTGKLADWDIDTSLGYTRVDLHKDQFGATNVPALFAALNRTSNPYLITGGNSAADNAAIYPTASASNTSKLYFGEFNATRSLANLAGGDLGFGAGVQYIYRDLVAQAPDLVAQGIIAGNNAYVTGTQSDTALYAEIVAPVLNSLELDAHVRFDHFDNAGSATTPSVGFKFKPIEQFVLRGTLGKGFRAPNPAENGNAGQSFSAGTTFDPLLCQGGSTTRAGNVISQCNFNPISLNVANPKLKPEKSTSATLGIVVEPIPQWSSTLDYYQVDIKDQIVAGTSDVINGVRGSPVSDTCSDGAGGAVPCTPAVGPILYIPVSFVNANSTKVTGIEFNTRYKLMLGNWGGSLTTEFDWSHMMSYLFKVGGVEYQLAGTHGPAVIGGNTGNPKDRMQASVTVDKGPMQVRLAFNMVGKFDLTDPSGSNVGAPVLTCEDAVTQGGYFAAWFLSGEPTNSKYCKIPSFLDTDLSASYNFNEHLTIHGAITNLFNEQPPLDLNTYGGGNLPYDPSMHQAGAIGRFFNVGLNYKL